MSTVLSRIMSNTIMMTRQHATSVIGVRDALRPDTHMYPVRVIEENSLSYEGALCEAVSVLPSPAPPFPGASLQEVNLPVLAEEADPNLTRRSFYGASVANFVYHPEWFSQNLRFSRYERESVTDIGPSIDMAMVTWSADTLAPQWHAIPEYILPAANAFINDRNRLFHPALERSREGRSAPRTLNLSSTPGQEASDARFVQRTPDQVALEQVERNIESCYTNSGQAYERIASYSRNCQAFFLELLASREHEQELRARTPTSTPEPTTYDLEYITQNCDRPVSLRQIDNTTFLSWLMYDVRLADETCATIIPLIAVTCYWSNDEGNEVNVLAMGLNRNNHFVPATPHIDHSGHGCVMHRKQFYDFVAGGDFASLVIMVETYMRTVDYINSPFRSLSTHIGDYDFNRIEEGNLTSQYTSVRGEEQEASSFLAADDNTPPNDEHDWIRDEDGEWFYWSLGPDEQRIYA